MKRLDMAGALRLLALCVFGLFVLLFACTTVPQVFLLAWGLVSGVWAYPAEVLPRVRPGAAALVTGALALAITGVGAHLTASWLHRERRGAEARWKPRWTAAMLALFFLTFAVAIDAAALAHQTLWLVQAAPKTVMYDTYRDEPFELRAVCGALFSPQELDIHRARAARVGRWDIEIVYRSDGSPGGGVARALDPRDPFAGKLITCDGPKSEDEVREYTRAIESSAARP